jgi:hypothetical protein
VTLTAPRYERLRDLPDDALYDALNVWGARLEEGDTEFAPDFVAAVEETERRLRTGALT